jgi:Fusaric acid resistance protein-like
MLVSEPQVHGTRSSAVTATAEQTRKTNGSETSLTAKAVSHGVLLSICCLLSYKIITDLLDFTRFVPRDDELLGGMWAVVATIFVFRYSHEESVSAALSRISATLLSFALCFVYLLILPFRPWGMAVLIGIGAIVLALIGRSGDIITAGITITVVMVVAGISPEHAWKQPILRLIDTVVGILVGIVGAWITTTLDRHIPSRSPADLRQAHRGGIP